MSAQSRQRRMTAPQILARKNGAPIVALTAYNALIAGLVDQHADIILVGDSLAMVEHGMDTTLGATLDLMILHGRSVMRGSQKALVAVDLPFSSYEESPEQAFRNAARVMAETGCSAVKLEGGAGMAATIAFLTARGIPVIGHIGLTPQSVMTLGGFKAQGRERSAWDAIEADAVAVADAGAFAVVVEGVVAPLADRITKSCRVPTIGIGGSNQCDGQILVLEDMLGLTDQVPRFVRRFGDLRQAADRAIADYAAAVRERSFPGPEHLYQPKE